MKFLGRQLLQNQSKVMQAIFRNLTLSDLTHPNLWVSAISVKNQIRLQRTNSSYNAQSRDAPSSQNVFLLRSLWTGSWPQESLQVVLYPKQKKIGVKCNNSDSIWTYLFFYPYFKFYYFQLLLIKCSNPSGSFRTFPLPSKHTQIKECFPCT